MPDRLLVAEDRENLRALLVRLLAAEFDVDEAADGAAALRALPDGRYAVVVTDVRMPGATGEEVLAAARALPMPPEVVLMTAYAEVPAAVRALKAGAYDYLAKPFDPADLLRVVKRAAERRALVGRARDLEEVLDAREGALLGVSAAMSEVRRLVERLGPLPIPVLLHGESGTGKEVVARELARLHGGPFVAVNCGAFPEPLLEAELFGTARGAFTGATERRGLFEAAHGGTLFLDEIADLPLPLQVKLNRALEDGSVRRLGETRDRSVSVRVITATWRDVAAAVAAGTFREDLYWRIKGFGIDLAPLRQRPEDVPVLAARFLAVARSRLASRARRIDPDALAALERAPWPGNVRELKHVVETAAVMADGEAIAVADLPEPLRARAGAPAGTYRAAVEGAADRAGREYLTALLQRTRGNVTAAAAEAGVERETLHRLLKKHAIEAAKYRG